MIKVLNNFLKEDEFKIIEDKIMSNEFPWYFQNETVTSVNYKEIPQFTHVCYLNNRPHSDYFYDLIPILEKLNAYVVLRMKFNLQNKYNNHVESGMHTDYIGTDLPVKTAILYMNTNNGYTKFESGEKIYSERNKLVVFDGKIKHTGATHTCDTFRRVVLNINFLEKNKDTSYA